MKKMLIVLMLCIASAAYCGLTSSIAVETFSLQTGDAVGDSTPADRYLYDVLADFTDGSGDDQAELIYKAALSIGPGASQTLDMFSGLSDTYGDSLSFATVKAFVIYNNSASQTLTIGSGTYPLTPWSNISTSTLTIEPSGSFLYISPHDGYAVATGSAQNFHFENDAGATCAARLFILGTSN